MTERANLAPAPPVPAATPAPVAAAPAAPARAPGGSPATWIELLSRSPPDTRAAQLGSLHRAAGNRAVARLVSGAAPDPSLFAALKDFGFSDLLAMLGFGGSQSPAQAP